MHTKLVLNFVFVLLISLLLLNVSTETAKNQKLIPLLSQRKLNKSKVESALKSTSRKLLTHSPIMKISQLLRKSVGGKKNIRLRKRVTKRLLKKIQQIRILESPPVRTREARIAVDRRIRRVTTAAARRKTRETMTAGKRSTVSKRKFREALKRSTGSSGGPGGSGGSSKRNRSRRSRSGPRNMGMGTKRRRASNKNCGKNARYSALKMPVSFLNKNSEDNNLILTHITTEANVCQTSRTKYIKVKGSLNYGEESMILKNARILMKGKAIWLDTKRDYLKSNNKKAFVKFKNGARFKAVGNTLVLEFHNRRYRPRCVKEKKKANDRVD